VDDAPGGAGHNLRRGALRRPRPVSGRRREDLPVRRGRVAVSAQDLGGQLGRSRGGDVHLIKNSYTLNPKP
jgi:hypothetical protein